MRQGRLLLACFALVLGCSRPTTLRVRLELADGAPVPDTVTLSAYDKLGIVADTVDLGPGSKLPGDVLLLLSRSAGGMRVLAIGEAGTDKLSAVGIAEVQAGRESLLTLTLSTGAFSDQDLDGVPDVIDNCVEVANPDQADDSGLGVGQVCRSPGDPQPGPDFGPPNNGQDLGPVGGDDFGPFPDMTVIKPASCGDGVTQAPEQCDEGANNSDDAAKVSACTSLCQRRASCGAIVTATATSIDPSNGHCYVALPGPLNWASASRDCQVQGGHLAVVTSKTEDDRIRAMVPAAVTWLGLEIDHGQPGPNRWVTGEAFTYSGFAAMEPNNGGAGSPEGCGVYAPLRPGWDDRPCGFPSTAGNGSDLPGSQLVAYSYVCEHSCGNGVVETGETCDPPGPTCTTTCQTRRPCTEAGGVVGLNGHCYFALATALSYPLASAACPAGTHLATLDEISENLAGTQAIGAAEAWISLRAPTTIGVFRWESTTEIFNSQRFHGFTSNEPNDSQVPTCVRITPADGWRDRLCNNTYVPLCERE